jgi:hypothetical protein
MVGYQALLSKLEHKSGIVEPPDAVALGPGSIASTGGAAAS